MLLIPRDAMRKRGLFCRPVSVRPSVSLVYCIQTAEDIVKLLSRPGSPINLVFLTPNADTFSPSAGALNTQRVGKLALYLANSSR